MIIKSGIISSIGMAPIYVGLLHLGAMANGNNLGLGRAALVMYLAEVTSSLIMVFFIIRFLGCCKSIV